MDIGKVTALLSVAKAAAEFPHLQAIANSALIELKVIAEEEYKIQTKIAAEKKAKEEAELATIARKHAAEVAAQKNADAATGHPTGYRDPNDPRVRDPRYPNDPRYPGEPRVLPAGQPTSPYDQSPTKPYPEERDPTVTPHVDRRT